MHIVSVIGLGKIGRPVVDWVQASGHWSLGAVLVRRPRALDAATVDPDAFFSTNHDLILDLAGPAALRSLGARALQRADLWTVSGAALADPAVMADLESAGRRAGHRLRVLGGAAVGLDGIAALAAGGASDLRLTATRPGMPVDTQRMPIRAAARDHPGETSFAAAAALAGPGLDSATLELRNGPDHALCATATGAFGVLDISLRLAPPGPGRPHPVACSVIAALQRETQVIWSG